MDARRWIGLGLVCVLAFPGATLVGAENKRLMVTGAGHVDVRPDLMELTATVVGSAELTSSALKKFRDTKRRGLEAIKKLKVDGLQIKEGGISVLSNGAMMQYQQVFGGNAQQMAAGHTTFSEILTFTVSGIDRLPDDKVQDLATKILDAAKDSGLTIGQSVDPYRRYYDSNSYRPQIVVFRVSHPEQAREKALDLAAADARKKGEQMAKRLEVALGKAMSVRDSSQPLNLTQPNYANQMPQAASSSQSTTLHNVSVDAMLHIEYEILN